MSAWQVIAGVLLTILWFVASATLFSVGIQCAGDWIDRRLCDRLPTTPDDPDWPASDISDEDGDDTQDCPITWRPHEWREGIRGDVHNQEIARG